MYADQGTYVADKNDGYVVNQRKHQTPTNKRSKNYEKNLKVPKYCWAWLALLIQPRQSGKIAKT